MAKTNGDTHKETMNVKVRAGGRDSTPVEVTYDIGTDLDSLVAQFGAEIVFSKAREKIVINLQDYLRNHAKSGKAADELQDLASKWAPGMRAPGATKAEKAKTLFASLSAEERAAVLKQLGVS